MIPATYYEFIMALVGLVIGVIYAFDGWTSTAAARSLKDSPRLVNFKYVITVFFVTLIADFSKMDASIQKGRLLQVYLGWLVITVLLVLIVVAVGVGCQFRKLTREYRGIQFPGFHPVLHFLMYGFRSADEKIRQSKDEWSKSQVRFYSGFLPQYNKQVTGAILAVNHALQTANDGESRVTAASILLNVEAVVKAYNRDAKDLEISANYMRACLCAEASEEQKAAAKFRHKDWDHYGHLLILEQYASDPHPALFTLPVWKNTTDAKDHVLPGAPEAFLNGGTALVTKAELKYAKALPSATVKEIKAYFDQKGLENFLSMPILSSGFTCGVLNIEANHIEVFGHDDDARREIVGMLNPFCHLLGFLINS